MPICGIAPYFACIDLHFVLRKATISPNIVRNGKGCVCAKTAMAVFAHTHPLNWDLPW